MNSSFRILRVRGIEIGANWSWLLVFALIIWQLANGIFPSAYPGLADSSYWTMGVVTAVLFIISLLLHELGHAFRAQKEGMEIEGITLWVFGGVAKFKGTFPSAGAEFRIAIAGPLVTVVLGLAFFGLFAGLSGGGRSGRDHRRPELPLADQHDAVPLQHDPGAPARRGPGAALGSLAPRRQLRPGDRDRGRHRADVRRRDDRVRHRDLHLHDAVQRRLPRDDRAVPDAGLASRGGVRGLPADARRCARPRPDDAVTADGDPEPDDRVVHQRRHARSGHSTYPVVDLNGQLLGLASLRLAAGVPFDNRGTTSVRDVMLTVGSFPVLSPHDEISQVLPMLRQGPGRAVVMETGRVVGMLSMSDVARAIELEQIRDPNAVQPGTRSRRGAFVLFAVLALVFAGVAYSPPFVVLAPGTAFDVTRDIHIKGTKTDKVNGQFLLTSVAVQQPKLFGLLAAMAEGKDTAPLDAVVPRNVDPEEYFKQQEKLFRESQLVAAAAAATAAGYDVKITGGGAVVTGVREGGPAATSLRDNDVIVDVDGKRVRTVEDVIRAYPRAPVRFGLRDARGAQGPDDHRACPQRGRDPAGRPGDRRVPRVEGLRRRPAVHDQLPQARDRRAVRRAELRARGVRPDVAAGRRRGRDIATTGTMDLEGRVGPIGGIEEKASRRRPRTPRSSSSPLTRSRGPRGPGSSARRRDAEGRDPGVAGRRRRRGRARASRRRSGARRPVRAPASRLRRSAACPTRRSGSST